MFSTFLFWRNQTDKRWKSLFIGFGVVGVLSVTGAACAGQWELLFSVLPSIALGCLGFSAGIVAEKLLGVGCTKKASAPTSLIINKAYIRSFLVFSLCSFTLATGMLIAFAYFGLEKWFSTKGMKYVLPYIALICCCYGACAAGFARRITLLAGINKWLLSAMVVFVSALLAMPLAGVLFYIQDMLFFSGFPADPVKAITNLVKGFYRGAYFGFAAYRIAIPYTTLCCAILGTIGTVWLSHRCTLASTDKDAKMTLNFVLTGQRNLDEGRR